MVKYINILGLLLLLLCMACKEQLVEINKFSQENGIGLVGEINQMDTVIVALVNTGNLITGMEAEPIDNAEISLLNQDNDIISAFFYSTFNKWNASLLPKIKMGDKYTIQAKVNGVELSATTQIPPLIKARIVKNEKVDNGFNIEIEIENSNVQEALCTVELLSYADEVSENYENISSRSFTRILLNTDDQKTDNIKYNELTIDYEKIFLPIKANNTSLLHLNVSEDNINANTHYCFWIKSLEKTYYQYVYGYELQKSQILEDALLQVQTVDNIKNGIGIWGGCYKVELGVDLFK